MKKDSKIHPDILRLVEGLKGKRALAVVNHILKHGSVTTEDLEEMGYKHPPRAVRDVRENGIPIVTKRITGTTGRRIAEYTFGDPNLVQGNKLGGRKTFSKSFKIELFEKQHGRCAICNEEYDIKLFQIDHRIPYEFSGDTNGDLKLKEFMLLCATCNRMKDRASETGCKNTCFRSGDKKIMMNCFWASPENYTHICMEPIRRTEIVWKGKETKIYDFIKRLADEKDVSVSAFIKREIQIVREGYKAGDK